MDFVLFLVLIGYIIYNGLQVNKMMNGKRFESGFVLFFFACFIDGWNWAKTKF